MVAVRRTEATLTRASSATTEQRLAATLLLLADRLGTAHDGGTLIDAPLSRDDLASLTGCASETASRILARLQREGIIDSGRRWVAVIDRPSLERLATTTS